MSTRKESNAVKHLFGIKQNHFSFDFVANVGASKAVTLKRLVLQQVYHHNEDWEAIVSTTTGKFQSYVSQALSTRVVS